ncbi:hypothetical protein MJN76_34275, partial [Salmonella enterica subsp. enterica serovar Anatum]|nr:hypothetical protein [Salmonella enterica subsp. enterica serovar Anatum]
TARTLLQSQQNSDEALSIKRDADPAFDFCGYLEALPDPDGMYHETGLHAWDHHAWQTHSGHWSIRQLEEDIARGITALEAIIG